MAQLQFLNGVRDAEVQDLVEEAGLNLGSADGSYITVKDQAVEARHAVIYSVKGQFYVKPESPAAKCFVNFRPLPPEGQAIADRDILMFGRTLAKFWRQQAPATIAAGVTMGAPAGGASAADLARLTKERDEARAQAADHQLKLKQLDVLRAEKDDLSKQLEAARAQAETDLSAANQGKADAEQARDAAQAKLDEEKTAHEATRAELEKEKARASSAEEEANRTKPELEKKDQELEAVRKALEALQAADEVAKRDRRAALRQGSDLAQLTSALAVPDSVRDRIAAAIQDEVDRALIARDGATVPLRGLRCPGCDADLERELSAIKARRRQADALRALGAASLTADEVKALVEKVRGKA